MDIKVIASGSTGNAYRISDGQTTLLLDAGIPFKKLQVALGFGICDVNACLLSHEHQDHAKAVTDLLKSRVPVYCSKGTKTALGVSDRLVHDCAPLVQFIIGSFVIVPFELEHDAEQPFGYLMRSRITGEKLLFATDTYYIRYKFMGLTHIMIECNHSIEGIKKGVENGLIDPRGAERLMKSHMSIERLSELLRANDLTKVRQIYLMHLSNRNGDAEGFKKIIQRLTGKEVYVC